MKNFSTSFKFSFSLRSNDDQASFWSEYAGSTMQKHWTCSYCNEDILVTVAERIAHENQCQLSCKDYLSFSFGSVEFSLMISLNRSLKGR